MASFAQIILFVGLCFPSPRQSTIGLIRALRKRDDSFYLDSPPHCKPCLSPVFCTICEQQSVVLVRGGMHDKYRMCDSVF